MYYFFLQEKCRDFEENSWFDTMLFYGFRHDEIIESVDDDIKLLPTVVEKIIQPRLTGKINNSLSVTDEIVSSVIPVNLWELLGGRSPPTNSSKGGDFVRRL